MKRNLMLFGTAVAALMLLAIPAMAIIWSGPDNDAHPWVGLVMFDVDGVPSHRCSGTLISDTVLLTAGHCTARADGARVWFDQEVLDPSYPDVCGTANCVEAATIATHPEFDNFASFPNTHDVGVVVLSAPIDPSGSGTFGELATDRNEIDRLARRRGRQDVDFTIVGYGVQSVVPFEQSDRVRYVGFPQLVELGSANTGGFNIHLTGNPGVDHPGGACFGDSGGPVFAPGSDTIVAGVASFVLNQNCVGASFYYRVDASDVREFVESVSGGEPQESSSVVDARVLLNRE